MANLVANSEGRTSFEEVQVKQRMKHQIMLHSVYYQILNISTKNRFFARTRTTAMMPFKMLDFSILLIIVATFVYSDGFLHTYLIL